jgi:hypothetical protein
MRVCKPSGKPFKSGHKINTVAGMAVNPNTGKPAYTFVEDDSVVDIRTCREVHVNVELCSGSVTGHHIGLPHEYQNGKCVNCGEPVRKDLNDSTTN